MRQKDGLVEVGGRHSGDTGDSILPNSKNWANAAAVSFSVSAALLGELDRGGVLEPLTPILL